MSSTAFKTFRKFYTPYARWTIRMLRWTPVKLGWATRPSAMIVGVQKGGTTGLWATLAQHPFVRSGEEKELHYFDREDRYRPGSHTTYHVRIPTRFELKRGSVVIDSTPFYSNSVLALDRIAAYNPGMKLIFVMREPISRAFSSWKMMHSRWPTGDEWHDKREFDEAIASNFETFGRTNPWHNYLERGVYADTIQRLWDRFPREQVLLLQSRQIAEFSEQTSRQIQEFLGIPHRDLAPIHRNVAPTQSEPISPSTRAQLEAFFQPQHERLEALLGQPIHW